ncbi:maltose O-acetyltransferase [Pustulibacterium marinum]|uniref:Maltose O-acetyltransferase n=1 Tax=Pustulibacterium marinum TaxID=1224947 RepID=A0A1I7HXP3_9FLAO|nr:sugar O-acetyltransferase [Pustulibacterium marinum]SFU65488.1 maltose O-acetyltransferase [Pustulibacterium marinum]
MKSEKEKMISGDLYNAMDEQLADDRLRTRTLLKALNDSKPHEVKERNNLVAELIPNAGKGLWIEPPFYCDYGYNLQLGEKVYFNFNCTVLDIMPITIGSRTLIGPSVQIYGAIHPMNAKERAGGLEAGKPITIGEDVWIGGNATICPGVTIGDRVVIGAGSVVTKDIPSDTFAAGNPCKVIREIPK